MRYKKNNNSIEKLHFGKNNISNKKKALNKHNTDKKVYKNKKNNCSNIKKSGNKIENFEIATVFIFSILLFILIESISRQSISETFSFIVDRPLNAVVNLMILIVISGTTIIIKRKRFTYFIILVFTIGLAIISAALMNVRGMPLSPYDIMSYKEAIGIASIFINIRAEIVAILVVGVFIFISVWIFVKDSKSIWITGIRNIFIYIIILSLCIIIIPQLKEAKVINTIAWDVGLSFKNNGFAYSLVDETFSMIRSKPDGYSEEAIRKIREEVDKKEKEDGRKIYKSKQSPNIIMVQLEAFMDPTKIQGITFNKDPITNMRKLMKNYTSGYMNVPVVGGGTARTEYEVLSGSNFNYLEQGEIPYHTFLSEKPSISIATNLKKKGYKTVAIHNYIKKFYNRDNGLANLGFEKFIPLEVMTNVEYTPMGWPRDEVLTKYITQEIDSKNDKPSFIFTISTQGHSRYPMGNLSGVTYNVDIVDSKLPLPDQNQIKYYANQVYEMDRFVGKLVKEINKLKKPTVLVLYGDHLPALNVITSGKSKLDKFSSIFVAVNNFGVSKQEIEDNFESYQLSTLALDIAKQGYGPMNLIHKYLKDDKGYQKKIELVQYDILFGKKYFLKNDEIPVKTKMKIGNDDMKLEKIENINGEYYLRGSGFNRQISVFVNGKKVDSDYENDTTIKLYDNYYTGYKEIFLKLMDKDGDAIQESNKIKYKF